MKKNYLNLLTNICAVFLITFYSFGQQSNPIWTKVSKQKLLTQESVLARSSEPLIAQFYKLDIDLLRESLMNAPNRDAATASKLIIEMPTSEGKLERFTVMRNSVMHPDLQVKFPEIQTYIARSVENPSASMYLSVTPKGFHAMTLSSNIGTQYIDPFTDKNGYVVYSKSNLSKDKDGFNCEFSDPETQNVKNLVDDDFNRNINDGLRRIYELAVGCSVNYTNFHGGTVASALAAMVVSINRVSGIYDRDFSVRFELVPDNNLLISTNGDEIFGNTTAVINSATNTINGIIGFANYDIGHVFTTGAGGLAGFGVVCTSGKGRGITGIGNPVGDPFDVDYVAHEIGHQFGGSHTFNGSTGNCAGGNRSASSAYEPGSGTTIMAYAGICPGQNVQGNSDDYFHRRSILQISNFIQSGAGSNCPTTIATGNGAPTAEAGPSFNIPISTPYKLTGSSTDDDGIGAHTFTWEQYDLGPAGVPTITTTNGPMVRTFPGTTSPIRYIPRLPDILNNGGVSTTWEKLASVSRVHTFELTVRDNDNRGGQTASDNMTATTVDSAGPFAVTSQSTAVSWQEGSTQTITWDVANTDVAPVSSPNVNILLSTNGGITFPFVLAANVPNDGVEALDVPSGTVTSNARIMVESSGNIFFNVNATDFSITEAASFSLNLLDTQAFSCKPDTVVYNFTYNAVVGFDETTTFRVDGLPAGASAVFNPESTSVDKTAIFLTISSTPAVIGGNYNLNVIGTATTETNSVELLYNVASSSLAASSLVAPANNTIDFSVSGSLEWQEDVEAESYFVEIATDANFTAIIESANVNTPNYSPGNLEGEIQYFWRVTASNACITASPSTIFNFTTIAVDCDVFTAVDVPIIISDSGTPTVESRLNVSVNDAPISDVNVTVNITHTWVNDLVLILKSPAGTQVVLSRNNGVDAADDYTNTIFDQEAAVSIVSGSAPFTGSFVPEGDLSSLYGEFASGEWVLTVNDAVDDDGGTLDGFTLEICAEGTLSTKQSTFQDFAIFPNPNKGEFTVKLNSVSNNAIKIDVLDMRGRKIFDNTYRNSSAFNEVVKLNKVQSGIYLVNVSDGDKTSTKKIIIE